MPELRLSRRRPSAPGWMSATRTMPICRKRRREPPVVARAIARRRPSSDQGLRESPLYFRRRRDDDSGSQMRTRSMLQTLPVRRPPGGDVGRRSAANGRPAADVAGIGGGCAKTSRFRGYGQHLFVVLLQRKKSGNDGVFSLRQSQPLRRVTDRLPQYRPVIVATVVDVIDCVIAVKFFNESQNHVCRCKRSKVH